MQDCWTICNLCFFAILLNSKLLPPHPYFGFLPPFLVGLYSIHRLALVKEEGEVEEKIVLYELLSEIRRPIRNFSTADGLQQMVQFPFSIVRSAIENKKEKKNL
ncbi:MAG: hypothetical protein MUP85_11655 [Candidatus Lokiarchaeota archaeon]|nr:hypothetical protein [Candidatus Lokiarchaeota archaeon]